MPYSFNFSIDNQHVDKIIRDQFNSVYSKSYNGLPQGFNPLGGLETSEPTVIQTRNTETRENYLVKVVEDPIKGSFRKDDVFRTVGTFVQN